MKITVQGLTPQMVAEQMKKRNVGMSLSHSNTGSIAPDTWKNIPYPIISAIKILVESSVTQYQKTNDIRTSIEENKKKTLTQLGRMEKEANKREEKWDQLVDRLEKNMSSAYNKLRIELENMMQKAEVVNDLKEADMKSVMQSFQLKLSKVEETEVVKHWAAQQIKKNSEYLNDQIDTGIFELQKQINDIQENHLEAPGFFGKDEQIKSVALFLSENQPKIEQKLIELGRDHEQQAQKVEQIQEEMNWTLNQKIDQEVTTISEKVSGLGDQIKDVTVKSNQTMPKFQTQLDEFLEEQERQRIEVKVRLELANNHMKTQNENMDKQVAMMNQMREEIEKKKEEAIQYNQEINNRMRETVMNLQKLVEKQKEELDEKIFKVSNVMDRNNKNAQQSQQLLLERFESGKEINESRSSQQINMGQQLQRDQSRGSKVNNNRSQKTKFVKGKVRQTSLSKQQSKAELKNLLDKQQEDDFHDDIESLQQADINQQSQIIDIKTENNEQIELEVEIQQQIEEQKAATTILPIANEQILVLPRMSLKQNKSLNEMQNEYTSTKTFDKVINKETENSNMKSDKHKSQRQLKPTQVKIVQLEQKIEQNSQMVQDCVALIQQLHQILQRETGSPKQVKFENRKELSQIESSKSPRTTKCNNLKNAIRLPSFDQYFKKVIGDPSCSALGEVSSKSQRLINQGNYESDRSHARSVSQSKNERSKFKKMQSTAIIESSFLEKQQRNISINVEENKTLEFSEQVKNQEQKVNISLIESVIEQSKIEDFNVRIEQKTEKKRFQTERVVTAVGESQQQQQAIADSKMKKKRNSESINDDYHSILPPLANNLSMDIKNIQNSKNSGQRSIKNRKQPLLSEIALDMQAQRPTPLTVKYEEMKAFKKFKKNVSKHQNVNHQVDIL